jgi:hypothetical protein
MTQAVNLANFANYLDSSGGVSPSALSSPITDTQLSATGVTAGEYGSSLTVPVITVSSKGRVTDITTANFAGGQYLGTAAIKAISYNAQTIDEDITIPPALNALSAGPISIGSGFSVVVDSTSNWTII